MSWLIPDRRGDVGLQRLVGEVVEDEIAGVELELAGLRVQHRAEQVGGLLGVDVEHVVGDDGRRRVGIGARARAGRQPDAACRRHAIGAKRHREVEALVRRRRGVLAADHGQVAPGVEVEVVGLQVDAGKPGVTH